MKIAVITGSSMGFGFELARCFVKQGYGVTLSGRSDEHLQSAEEELKEFKQLVFTVRCDVRNYNDLSELWNKSVEKWGHIDIWINNAGISQTHVPLHESIREEIQDLFNVNLFGVIHGTQIAIKGMMEQGYGQVFNVEGFGSDGSTRTGLNIYGTSKRAVTHITKAFSDELKGKTVFAGLIAPGMMSTNFIKNYKGNPAGKEASFRIFNILGDKPEVPARYLSLKMMNNKKNAAHFRWLTPAKAMYRFIRWNFVKRNIFD